MLREHSLIYGVYLAIMYLRGDKSFNELEWKMMTNWIIDRKNTPEATAI